MDVRRVAVYGSLMGVTVAAGLALRFAPLGLPPFAVKYGGSTMWAVMIYWVLALPLPKWQPARLALLAGVIATAVELLKLYRSPGLDAFRLTLAGVLLLGRYFSVWDLVAYWMAIACAAVMDELVLRRGEVERLA